MRTERRDVPRREDVVRRIGLPERHAEILIAHIECLGSASLFRLRLLSGRKSLESGRREGEGVHQISELDRGREICCSLRTSCQQ